LKKIICITLVFCLLGTAGFSAFGCGVTNAPVPEYWEPLLQDEEWVADLSQMLDLCYVEESEIAGFSQMEATRLMAPTLYSTWSVMGIVKDLGQEVEDPVQIADWVNSLRDDRGFYHDPLDHMQSTEETLFAISVLTNLGIEPEDVDSTVSYLLSLQDDDGLFRHDHDLEKGAPLSKTRERKISYGTYWVVETLCLLNRSNEKALEKTKLTLIEEINSKLPEGEPFPAVWEDEVGKIIAAISILAKLDSSLVTETARNFIAESLKNASSLPDHLILGVNRINNLLEIGELLKLPEANLESIRKDIEGYLTEKIFPLQGSRGGFEFGGSIEPAMTFFVVHLTSKLYLEYPYKELLLDEVERYRVDGGWVTFYSLELEEKSPYIFWTLEVANAIGYTNYNHDKIATYLRKELNNPDLGIWYMYYTVLALKSLNGSLSRKEISIAEESAIKLAAWLPDDLSSSPHFSDYPLFVLLMAEIGSELPEELDFKMKQIAEQAMTAMIEKEVSDGPVMLYYIWKMQGNDGEVLSRETALDLLDSFYTDYGGYLVSDDSWIPADDLKRPGVHATLYAVRLLTDMGESLPDKQKTLDFVMSSKYEYGFDIAPIAIVGGRSWPDILSTYVALTVLKDLSE